MTAAKKNNYFFSALLLGTLLASCAQQDAALLVTLSGPFNIPASADKLSLDVLDNGTVIKHKDWCYSTAGCDPLPAQTALSGTVTIVGGSHHHVKINAALYKGTTGQPIGLGTTTADFASGQTVQVTVTLAPQ